MIHRRARTKVLTALGVMLLVVSAAILGSHYFGQGRAGRTLSSAPLPSALGPVPTSTAAVTTPTATTPAATTPAPAPASATTFVADKPGVPVKVIVAGRGVQAPVSANRLNADGSMYVPANPRLVSWGSQQVGPGSSSGTAILVGHVDLGGVAGVFSDLAEYRVGQAISLVMADGRTLKYEVAAEPIEVNKDDVGRRRQELFDQSHSYGLPGQPKSGRLLLLSCGGPFDNRTGHYESNIFVFALPA